MTPKTTKSLLIMLAVLLMLTFASAQLTRQNALAQEELTSGSLFLPFIVHDGTPTPTLTLPPTETPTLPESPTPTDTQGAPSTPSPTETPTPLATATDAPAPPASQRRVNAPFFAGDVMFEQMAIFWFGYLSETSNYADVRVGYNQDQLKVYIAVFDRHLWFDTAPSVDTLTDWDAVTLLLDTDSDPVALDNNAHRFIAQLSGDSSPNHRTSYRGSATGWQGATLPFNTIPGWRGSALNNNADTDRGWAMTFSIPFSSLGFDTAPPIGSEWRIALQLHDRDGPAETPQPVQIWPPSMQRDQPDTWGRLRFGLPSYTPPVITPTGETTIRRPTQNHPSVPDADVGSAITNQCPGDDFHIWNEWANRNYGRAPDFNIQNQSDIADWPCFAKYYVTFPLDVIPSNKVIVSATLTLHQFGNAGEAGQAQPSWIQVLTTAEDWQESTITWNNAPLAWENITGNWVNPVGDNWNGWPGVPWTWDVSYAVANAHASGQPARLILYEADSAYHSGKFFVSSDTGDWNIEGRPTLKIVWGNR